MRICRPFTADPKPCSRCCVTLRLKLELVEGLKSLLRLLLELLLFPNPSVTFVPVRKPFVILKFPMFCRCTSSFVPVRNALLCGVVIWFQLKPVLNTGSKFGIAGPEDCTALP